MALAEIYNFVKIDDRIATAGQPTKVQFEEAAAEGYHAVINLAPYQPGNGTLADEEEFLADLGLCYYQIPVDWDNPTEHDFERFNAAMDTLRDQKLLIHCVANMRVTAFYARYAMQHLGWTQQQTDALMDPLWQPVWRSQAHCSRAVAPAARKTSSFPFYLPPPPSSNRPTKSLHA